MSKKLLVLAFLVAWSGILHAQVPIFALSGKVLSKEDQKPLPGALVTLGENKKIGITDESGSFTIEAAEGTYLLRISYMGMTSFQMEISLPAEGELLLELEPDTKTLQEVTVMSTGYQDLPAERVTGSFVAIDRELINRRVSTNLMDRLEDVTPGLIFNRGPQTGKNQISIRGRSTLFANTEPLIVVDNFPYDGPLESINPNDIEQITILKDAAAASIWGARAGNGVIVITTKSGSITSSPQVSFNSNVNIFEEQDLFYVPQMNMGDFVDIQSRLFQSNFYRSQELNPSKAALPQVVETLIAKRDGRITASQADAQLEYYKNQDLRTDLGQYYYRPRVNQQYSLAVSGGGTSNTYQFSLGYDKNLQSVYGNEDDRWTIQAKNSWSFLKNKLQWSVGAYLAKSQSTTGTGVPQNNPYSRLVDESGNPVPIFTNLSSRYLQTVQNAGLLDWFNITLNEIGMLDYRNDRLDGRFQTGLNYKIIDGLSADVSYQYWTNRGRNRELNPQATYFTRDLINKFTQIDDQGILRRPIPVGDILDLNESFSYSHTLRGMLTYRKSWKNTHQLTAIAGTEVRDLRSESNGIRYYGYNDLLGTSAVVDQLSRYPYYHNQSLNSTIDAGNSHTGLTDRFLSFYGNGGYTFKNKLDATFSIRKDQSNFFGVTANRRGVPLWSAGLGWTISEENFASFLNGAFLKWKASYGYSGNLDKSLSGRLTASYYSQPSNRFVPNIPAAHVANPPNPDLSWEKVAIWNSGFDFESASGRYKVSLEVYSKKGSDLIGDFEVAPSTGFYQITGNYAETQTTGIDLVLGADWLKGGLKWKSDFFYSKVNDRITKVDVTQTAGGLLNSFYNASPIPVEGRPMFSVYSYHWAGLNPDNGNPMGLIDGEPSENYIPIISTATPESLLFHGSARPTDFGALRNTFAWKEFNLSVNISYRLGYYYRKRSIDYFSLLRGQIGQGDYDNRWLQPGDEQFTQIPSLPTTANYTRNLFYTNSAVLVERGDHIRLQDIRLGYTMDKNSSPWLPFGRAEFYGYANNLGILWKASSDKLDPDFQTSAPLKSIALGLRIDF